MVLIPDLYFSCSQDQLWMNKGVQTHATTLKMWLNRSPFLKQV